MITLPSNFAAENAKPNNSPAYIAELQNALVNSIQTLESDWAAAAASSNMDYETPTQENRQGDVQLAQTLIPRIVQLTGTQHIGFYNNDQAQDDLWQSFKNVSGASRLLDTVMLRAGIPSTYGVYDRTIYVEVYASDKTTLLSSSALSNLLPARSGYTFYYFDFLSQGITLSDGQTYYLRIYADDIGGTPWTNDNPPVAIVYTPTNAYADGSLQFHDMLTDAWTTLGDAVFFVTMTGVTGNFFVNSGTMTTKTFDIGAVPTANGEVQIDDTVPAGCTAVYHLWSSPTGAFAGEETDLGVVEDGDPITTLVRYYRVSLAYDSNAAHDESPVLSAITLEFSTYRAIGDMINHGYAPEIMSVSGLESKISMFEPSSIGQITLTCAHSPAMSAYLNDAPKNRICRIKNGFVSNGFAAADFIDYFYGKIQAWPIGKDQKVSLAVQGYAKDWDVDVPATWETIEDDVSYVNWHPVDVMLDLLLNHIKERDSNVLKASFATVKALIPNWVVSRTITGNTESAADLLEELRVLTSTYFIPQPNGAIKLKRYDPTEAAVDSIDHDSGLNFSFDDNSGSLINRMYIYYGWAGTGDAEEDFNNLYIALNSFSYTQWNKQYFDYKLLDKWTPNTAQGLDQLEALAAIINARYSNPAPVISCEGHRSKIGWELGDMLNVTCKNAPSDDGAGIVNVKYQIVQKSLNFAKHTIKLKLERA